VEQITGTKVVSVSAEVKPSLMGAKLIKNRMVRMRNLGGYYQAYLYLYARDDVFEMVIVYGHISSWPYSVLRGVDSSPYWAVVKAWFGHFNSSDSGLPLRDVLNALEIEREYAKREELSES
jgi:hypothetical protein